MSGNYTLAFINRAAINNTTLEIRPVDSRGNGLPWSSMVIQNDGANIVYVGRTAAQAVLGPPIQPSGSKTIAVPPGSEGSFNNSIFVHEPNVGASSISGEVAIRESGTGFALPTAGLAGGIITPGL